MSTNAKVADSHIKRISGPTIMMGDGSYFDFEAPEASTMTIEDFAYGLAYTCRFRGQTRRRSSGERAFYSVAEHCVRMARHLWDDGYHIDAFHGLMHEAGEPVCGDMSGPLKVLIPEFRVIEKRCEAALLARFQVPLGDAELIKRYDLRMLATEKRDLMPHSAGHKWEHTGGYEPFEDRIEPWKPNEAAGIFLREFHYLQGAIR